MHLHWKEVHWITWCAVLVSAWFLVRAQREERHGSSFAKGALPGQGTGWTVGEYEKGWPVTYERGEWGEYWDLTGSTGYWRPSTFSTSAAVKAWGACCLILVGVYLACERWLYKSRGQFSLMDLFILITIVAVALAVARGRAGS